MCLLFVGIAVSRTLFIATPLTHTHTQIHNSPYQSANYAKKSSTAAQRTGFFLGVQVYPSSRIAFTDGVLKCQSRTER